MDATFSVTSYSDAWRYSTVHLLITGSRRQAPGSDCEAGQLVIEPNLKEFDMLIWANNEVPRIDSDRLSTISAYKCYYIKIPCSQCNVMRDICNARCNVMY